MLSTALCVMHSFKSFSCFVHRSDVREKPAGNSILERTYLHYAKMKKMNESSAFAGAIQNYSIDNKDQMSLSKKF